MGLGIWLSAARHASRAQLWQYLKSLAHGMKVYFEGFMFEIFVPIPVCANGLVRLV